MAVIMLIDPKTGAPQAIMDGTKITAVRTGAAAGVATKYLARAGSSKLGIVGAGVQASTQLEFMLQVADISEVRVYDVDDESKNRFVAWASKDHPDVKFIPAAGVEEVATNSDIICTVTPSRKPVIINEWVDYGTHINAIGADAPGKEELDPAILKRSKVVIDDWEQAWHSGEINVPVSKGLIDRSDIHGEIGEIIVGKKKGRASPREVTVFDSTGLAIQDTVVAKLLYKKATEKKVGTEIELSTLLGS
jgi:alanine dehydrogenase